jgi:hypothetical protein
MASSMSRPLLPSTSLATEARLDVGALQHLLQTVHLLRSLLHQRLAIARQLPQCPDRLGRDKTRFEQAMPQQVGQPFGIFHIRLAPGHRLHMLRVHQDHLAPCFQQVVHRMPIHPGRFHRDVLDSQTAQPFIQRQQISRHRRKGAHRLLDRSGRQGDQHTHHDGLLVNIQACTALVDHLHRSSPSSVLRVFVS